MPPKTTIDLPFAPEDIKTNVAADYIWRAIMNDDALERARARLSVDEMRRIVAHCLKALAETGA
jgi:hypothetical protein